MLGALTWEELEEMTIPDLFDRLDSVRRVDARRRLDALLASRASGEHMDTLVQELGEAAGVETMGDITGFIADLRGGL